MIDIKRSIARGWGSGGLYDILVQLQNLSQVIPVSGRTYYVSTTGNNTTGLTWKDAFTTLTAAFTASNAYIADSGKERFRNRIYVDGMSDAWNGYAEDITTLPAQTDVIGCGNGYSGLISIRGTHSIATATKNTRIFNFNFLANTASTPCFKVCDDCHGIEFHNCIFDGSIVATPTYGLQLGSISGFKVVGCRFVGNPLCTTGIQCDGPVAKGEILDNYINAKTNGIVVADTVTIGYQMLIKDNCIGSADPVAEDGQLTKGITFADTDAQVYVQVIHNWIAAADAIHFAGDVGNRKYTMVIDNHVVQTATADVESDENA